MDFVIYGRVFILQAFFNIALDHWEDTGFTIPSSCTQTFLYSDGVTLYPDKQKYEEER